MLHGTKHIYSECFGDYTFVLGEGEDASVSDELVNTVKALVLYYSAASAYFAGHTAE